MDDDARPPVETADTPASLEQLYALERGPMLQLAVLLVGSRALAEEIVQDAFIVVEERWDGLHRPGGYLRTVVVNQCRMLHRRRQVELRHLEVTPGTADSTELIELHDALRRLGARQRTAVVLRYLLDRPDAEIATLLECRPATVRSLVHRGLRRLRKDLR